MDERTFNRLRKLVYEESGISLGSNKKALLSARLRKRMRHLGIDHPKAYLKRVMEEGEDGELVRLLDAVSTNVTSFFREPEHFEFLARSVSEWAAQGQRSFRVWSAACSSGEEAYSIAITLLEGLRLMETDCRILATDISAQALEQARAGSYPPGRVSEVPAKLRRRYFEKSRAEDGLLVARADLRRMICFKRLNIAAPPFPMQGPFDVILCRNVMIYFDVEVRRKLLAEMRRLLRPGGFLIVGHAESLTGSGSGFRSLSPSIYVNEFGSEHLKARAQ